MSRAPHEPIDPEISDLTYECRDIHLKGVAIFVGITFVVVVVVLFGMLATLQGLRDREAERGTPLSPLVLGERGIETNVPMLQVWPVRELKAYHEREKQRLETSAEYTTPTGEVKYHIPVNHAMTLVLDELHQPPASVVAAPAAEEVP